MPGQLDKTAVLHLAKLAHLQLNEEDIEPLRAKLEKILGYVASIDAICDPAVIDEGSDSTPEAEDIVAPSLPVETFLSQAPAHIGTAFQVPRIIDADY